MKPAAHQRPHAGSEFCQREGFCEIAVRASVQTFHALFHQTTRGQHQYRSLDACLSQFAADLDAAEARQTDVQ